MRIVSGAVGFTNDWQKAVKALKTTINLISTLVHEGYVLTKAD